MVAHSLVLVIFDIEHFSGMTLSNCAADNLKRGYILQENKVQPCGITNV